MRGDGGNQNRKLELTRILCASRFTIPDTAGMSPDPACNHTDTMSSKPNQPSCTCDFSYPLVSSISFSCSSPFFLFLVHNSTIIAEHKVESSLSISPYHDHELTPSTALHWAQHTLSAAYTEYTIHRVQQTLSTAYSHDCLSSLNSPDYKLTPECCSSFRPHAFLQIDRHQPALHKSFKGKVTSLQSYGSELANWLREFHKRPACLPSTVSTSTTSNSSFTLARSKPARASPNSLDHSLGVHQLVHSIMAPTSASLTSLYHGLQVHLQTRCITASKCISEFTRSRPESASPNSLDRSLGV